MLFAETPPPPPQTPIRNMSGPFKWQPRLKKRKQKEALIFSRLPYVMLTSSSILLASCCGCSYLSLLTWLPGFFELRNRTLHESSRPWASARDHRGIWPHMDCIKGAIILKRTPNERTANWEAEHRKCWLWAGILPFLFFFRLNPRMGCYSCSGWITPHRHLSKSSLGISSTHTRCVPPILTVLLDERKPMMKII